MGLGLIPTMARSRQPRNTFSLAQDPHDEAEYVRVWVGVLGMRGDGNLPGCMGPRHTAERGGVLVSLLRALQEDYCGQVKASRWPRDSVSWA